MIGPGPVVSAGVVPGSSGGPEGRALHGQRRGGQWLGYGVFLFLDVRELMDLLE